MRPLAQTALGLTIGTALSLSVVATLLLTRDGGGDTFTVTPASVPQPPADSGLKATQGKDLVASLLGPEDLPGGWKQLPDKYLRNRSSGSLDKAADAIPESETDCVRMSDTAGSFLGGWGNPTAYTMYNRTGGGFGYGTERITVFRPGVAAETMLYLRGVRVRCAKVAVSWPNGRKTTRRFTIKAAPDLGDESLVFTGTEGDKRSKYDFAWLHVRFGDTIVSFYQYYSATVDQRVVEAALAKTGLRKA